MDKAIIFKHAHSDNKTSTATQIYEVHNSILQSNLQRACLHGNTLIKHSGHNKIFSDMQVDVIYKYVKDLYLSRYRATKKIVFLMIRYSKANEIPPKDTPTY